MKKPLIVVFTLVLIAFLAIMPGKPNPSECSKFHPHTEDFGGPGETLKVLSYLATNMPIKVWTDGIRTVVVATYQTKTIFMAYGTGNPTMFAKNVTIDYIRQQTSGHSQVTSPKGIQAARDHINSCLKQSFEKSISSVPSAISVKTALLISLYGLAGIGLVAGAGKLKGSRRPFPTF